MDFKAFIKEEKEKRVVFAFGQMNPLTSGHEKLINSLMKEAKSQGAIHEVVLTHSKDPKNNPLSPTEKLAYAKTVFPKTNIKLSTKNAPSMLHHLSKLYSSGNKHVTVFTDSNRKDEIENLINKYNGVEGDHGNFNFETIKVMSSGDRNPGVDGAEGSSSSKMRKVAEENDFKKFKELAPIYMQESYVRQMFNDVRRGMSLKEHRDIRERYVDGEIFNLGEMVQIKGGGTGEIVSCGASYVTVELNSGARVKHWIKDISEMDDSFKRSSKPALKENFPATYRNKFSEKKIPALCMTKSQLEEMQGTHKQISYQGYTTKHFDMCPTATKQMGELVKRTDLNPKFVLQAIQALDLMFGIEKAAVKGGFATQEMVHQYIMKLSIAHDTMNLLGISDQDMLYMEKHTKVMSKLSLHPDTSFANEYGTHTTVVSEPGEIEETAYSSDYKITTSGRKVRARRITTNKRKEKQSDLNSNGPYLIGAPPMSKTLSQFKQAQTVQQQLAGYNSPVEEEVVQEEIGGTPKDTFTGIDAPIHDQGIEGKPLGMVSFKDFPSKSLKMKPEVEHEHEAEIKSADAKTLYSPAYPMMRKAKMME
jgi:hypothetical protein